MLSPNRRSPSNRVNKSYASIAAMKKQSIDFGGGNLTKDLMVNRSGGGEHYTSVRNVSVLDGNLEINNN